MLDGVSHGFHCHIFTFNSLLNTYICSCATLYIFLLFVLLPFSLFFSKMHMTKFFFWKLCVTIFFSVITIIFTSKIIGIILYLSQTNNLCNKRKILFKPIPDYFDTNTLLSKTLIDYIHRIMPYLLRYFWQTLRKSLSSRGYFCTIATWLYCANKINEIEGKSLLAITTTPILSRIDTN